MSLETGAEINGRVVERLPITTEVIERVELLGKGQNQPYGSSNMLKYEWRPGKVVDIDDQNFDEETNNDITPQPINQADECEEAGSRSDLTTDQGAEEHDDDVEGTVIIGEDTEEKTHQGMTTNAHGRDEGATQQEGTQDPVTSQENNADVERKEGEGVVVTDIRSGGEDTDTEGGRRYR